MEDVDFFEGQRFLTRMVFLLNKSKTTITCTPWEEWKQIDPCPFTLRCGNKREEKLTRRYGIEHTQRDSFETTVGASLGTKGVAALESSLKSTLGHEIKLQVGTEQTQTFTFEAPKCGYKVVRLYQHVRAIHIKYDDTRFWHRSAVELTLFQWLPSIYDATQEEPYDPSCNCREMPEPEARQGIAARVVSAGLAKLGVYWTDSNTLEFPETQKPLNAYLQGAGMSGAIPSHFLPDYLRFLAGIEASDSIQAAARQEKVQFPATPSINSPSTVEIELDVGFRPVQTAIADLPLAV